MKIASQGERLKELMNNFNISQGELAKKLNIPKSSLSMYVSDKRQMRQDRIKALADCFNISEAWIMGYDVPMVLPDIIHHFTFDEYTIVDNNENPIDIVMDGVSDCAIKLMRLYKSLNKEGQDKLLTYADDLVSSNKYKKGE